PVKELVHFEKQLLGPGETRTFRFALDPWRDLSFPDKDGRLQLEDGSFELQVGNLQKRFWLRR
ncbi:MAG: fibronectin type III-like domain-contianing protein, partial [Saprospiraceae bacterium]|nr:fibronectin type III-like domain-contianing protein [Saprospiraceae bacterium]